MTDSRQTPDQEILLEDFKGPNKELRVLGAVCYFPGGFILPYMLDLAEKPFVFFHIKQGIIFFAVFMLIAIFGPAGSIGYGLFLYLIAGAWHAYKAFSGETYCVGFLRGILEDDTNKK